jgi:hypothetical protein
MSLTEAVKWFAIYILLTLVFTAITALGAFVYFGVSNHLRENYEFDTLFFFFLLLAGFFCVAVGVVIIIRTHLLTFGWVPASLDWILRGRHIKTKRKDGVLLILVGLTLILVAITQLWM